MSSSAPQRSRLVKRSSISAGASHSHASSSYIVSGSASSHARPSSVAGGGAGGGDGRSQGSGRGRLWDDEESQDEYDDFMNGYSDARAQSGSHEDSATRGLVARDVTTREEEAEYGEDVDEDEVPSLRRFLGSRHTGSSGASKGRPVISHDYEAPPTSNPTKAAKASKAHARSVETSSDIEAIEVGKRRRDGGQRRGVTNAGTEGSRRLPTAASKATSATVRDAAGDDYLEAEDLEDEDSAAEGERESDAASVDEEERAADGEGEAGIRSCVLMRQGMDALAAAVHFYARIGKELLLEARRDGLTLRTLNDAKTAFACTHFRSSPAPPPSPGGRYQETSPPRRDGYGSTGTRSSSGNMIETIESLPGAALVQDYEVDNEPFLAKLQLKPLVGIVKGLRRMRMLSLRSEVLRGVEHQVVLELLCDLGIRRTHRLVYQDCPSLSAVFDASGASSFTAEVAVFKQVLEQVGHSAQVMLSASRLSFKVASFHPELLVRGLGAGMAGAAAARRHLSTEMTLPTHEFLSYNYLGPGSASSGGAPLTPGATPAETQSQADAYGGSDELVLSTRELKSVISFCEATETPEFTLLFTSGGRPCKVIVEAAACTMSLVLATLGMPSAAASSSDPPSSAQEAAAASSAEPRQP